MAQPVPDQAIRAGGYALTEQRGCCVGDAQGRSSSRRHPRSPAGARPDDCARLHALRSLFSRLPHRRHRITENSVDWALVFQRDRASAAPFALKSASRAYSMPPLSSISPPTSRRPLISQASSAAMLRPLFRVTPTDKHVRLRRSGCFQPSSAEHRRRNCNGMGIHATASRER